MGEEVKDARAAGDARKLELAQRKVAVFTDQLNESNPILTGISDAMTLEGDLLEQAEALRQNGGASADIEALVGQAASWRQKKESGNVLLQQCSAKYGEIMKRI